MGPNSLAKSGRVLDALAAEGELSAAAIAERIDEPRSSVYRLLDGLRTLGYVEGGSLRGSYRLGLELLRLGSAVLARFDEREAARPALERLRLRTDQTAMLTVPRGREAVCIERIEGFGVNALVMRLGTALPLHVGGGPRALLAHRPPAAWDRYLDEDELERFTPRTPVDRGSLLPALEDCRRTGISISDEDVTIGVASIGAPVFGFGGDLRAAISIGGPKVVVLGPRRRELEAAVRRAAREASAALGFDVR